MADVEKILDHMRREPSNVKFGDLLKVCESFFGKPRQSGSSHVVFKTPCKTIREKPRRIRYGRYSSPSTS
jgi:hypothetical protein